MINSKNHKQGLSEKSSDRPVEESVNLSNNFSAGIRPNLLSSQVNQPGAAKPASTFGNPGVNVESVVQNRKFSSRIIGLLTVAVMLLLAIIFLFLAYNLYRTSYNNIQKSRVATNYDTTSVDLGTGITAGSQGIGILQVNGDANITNNVTANSFSGGGADLTNLNADNITSGTLNDARLSANVALLDANQTFTGNNTFAGANIYTGPSNFTGPVSLPGTLVINSLSYSTPSAQANGVLTNDGSGNLVWQAVGPCATCINNGGDSFGAAISIGTNDNNNLIFKTNNTTRLTFNTTGDATFTGAIYGDGTQLTGVAKLALNNQTFTGNNQVFQNTANSTTAFEVKNSGAVSVFTADTQNGKVIAPTIQANTITPTSVMTIGSTSQTLTLYGGSSSTWVINGTGFSTSVGFNGVPTSNVMYYFDRTAAAGNYAVCTSAGNCGGGGGITGGGTAGSIAKFSGPSGVTNSLLSESGSQITMNGTFRVVSSSPDSLTINSYGVAVYDDSAGTTTNYIFPANGNNTYDVCTNSGNCFGAGGSGANTALSNLDSATMAINTSLLPGPIGPINLGSNTKPFGELFIYGASATPATQNFKLTGSATGARTITFPDYTGTVCTTDGTTAQVCAGYANNTLSNLGTVALNSVLQPATAGALSLGVSTLPFSDLYLSGSSATPATNRFRITGTSAGGLRTITLPDESGTICTTGSVCSGYAPSTGGSGYVQLQATTPGTQQSGNLNLSGTGIFGSAVSLGTASAANGTIVIKNSTTAFDLTLNAPNTTTSNKTITFPNENGTVCTTGSTCSGYANNTLSNLGTVALTSVLQPALAGALSLGVSTLPFSDLYLSGSSATPATNRFLITGTSSGGLRTITLPDENGTVCTTGSVCSGYAPSTGGSGYVQLQATTPGTQQSGNLNLSGTGIFGSAVSLGTASAANGTIVIKNSTTAFDLTLNAPNTTTSNKTITFPNENGTVCTTGSVCSGYAPSTLGTGYIQNQISSAQTSSNFWISGTGIVGTKLGIGINANTFGTLEKMRIGTPTTTDNSANVMLATSATSAKGLVVQATAAQTANLQEWQDSTGTALSVVDGAGKVGVGNNSPTYLLDVVGGKLGSSLSLGNNSCNTADDTATNSAVCSITISNSYSSRYMVVMISYASTSATITSATYNGAAMTLLGSASQGANRLFTYVMNESQISSANPGGAAANVSATFSANVRHNLQAVYYYNASQTTPAYAAANATGAIVSTTITTTQSNSHIAALHSCYDSTVNQYCSPGFTGSPVSANTLLTYYDSYTSGSELASSIRDYAMGTSPQSQNVSVDSSSIGNPTSGTLMLVNVNPVGTAINTSGSVASISSTCAVSCTDSASILRLNQGFSSSTGTVLNVTGAGTGLLANFDASNSSANGLLVDVQSSSSSQYALKVTSNNGTTTAMQVNGDGGTTLGGNLTFSSASRTVSITNQATANTAGGTLTIQSAKGGAGFGATSGAGGGVSITAGDAGDAISPNASGNGGGVTITAGGSSSVLNINGTGGAVSITGGSFSALATGSTGGNVTINAGAGATNGSIKIGDTTAAGIDLGTSTGAQALNFGTAASGVKTVTFGNTGVASTYTFNSGVSTTSTAMTLTVNGLTTGKGLAINSTGTGLTGTGNMLSVSSATTGDTSTGIINFSFSGVRTTGTSLGMYIRDLSTTAGGTEVTDGTGQYVAGSALTINAIPLTSGVSMAIANKDLTTGALLYLRKDGGSNTTTSAGSLLRVAASDSVTNFQGNVAHFYMADSDSATNTGNILLLETANMTTNSLMRLLQITTSQTTNKSGGYVNFSFTGARTAGNGFQIDDNNNGTTAANSVVINQNSTTRSTGKPLVLSAAGTNTDMISLQDQTNTCTGNPGATFAWTCTSDQSYKENITDSPSILSGLTSLQIRAFDWKSGAGHEDYGVVAQEVETTSLNWLVKTDPETGIKSVTTPSEYMLIKGLQEVNTKVDTMQNGLSTSVLQIIADAGAITINGTLTINGITIFNGEVQFNSDTAGTATIPASQTSISVTFTKPMSKLPRVTATPQGVIDGSVGVTGKSVNGFTIQLQNAQASDIDIDWQALVSQ